MKSIVLQLEEAVMAAVLEATEGAVEVRGFREQAPEGEIKTQSRDGSPFALVQVAPGRSAGYASPVVEFAVSVRLSVRWFDDPRIAGFDEAAAPIERLFMRWNEQGGIEAMSAALSTENFRADGFRLDGGDDAFAGGDAAEIATTFNFAVKGVYKETQETEG